MSSRKQPGAAQKSVPGKRSAVGGLINQAAASARGVEVVQLRELRAICLALPEAQETVKWGHPTFEAGRKIFAVLDEYENARCIAFRATLEEQAKLLQDPRFFPAPYAAAKGWTCLRAEGNLDWREVRKLVLVSYRLVALKRMLAALGKG